MKEPQKTAVSQQPPTPKNLSEDKNVVKAAAILVVGNISSRILGLVREIVKARYFGTSPILAAFTVAALVPKTLFDLIIGGEMISSSLVPVFSDFAAKERREELWHLVSTFLSLATAVLFIVVLLMQFFAPQIAWLAGARNFEDSSLLPLTIQLTRLAIPTVLFLSIASIISGLLYALKRFTLPAFMGAVYNGTIVFVVLLKHDRIESLVWGMLIGSFLQIVLQLPALRDGRFRIQFNWQHPAIRRILVLYAPIVVGLLVNNIAIWITINFATETGDTNVNFISYATTLYQLPLGLVVSGLSMATLPTLSQLATAYRSAKTACNQTQATEQAAAFKETLAGGLRLAITLILPAMTGLFALALPIVALLFQRGEFTGQDSEMTALVLRIYLFGLPFAAIDQMLVFASYARKDTWRPALAGIIAISIYTFTAWVLLEPLGLLSLMVADATKHMVHTMIMLWFLKRQIGGLSGYHIFKTTLKSVAAAIITGLVAYEAAYLIGLVVSDAGFNGRLLLVMGGGGAGLIVYFFMVHLLGIPEAQALLQLFTNKLRKSIGK